MDVIQNIYQDTLLENKRNLKFWEDYLHSMKNLDFGAYSEKLKVPILVPIGSRILFRGELKHTNEVTAALGGDYFAKCSITQAEILRTHRIKDAQAKVNAYTKERDYLLNQFSFSKQKVFEDAGQEIIEHYTVEEDDAWRRQHRENVRRFKQNKVKEEVAEVDDEELWTRLEELELQEELENELQAKTKDTKEIENKLPYNFVDLAQDSKVENRVEIKNEYKEDSNVKMLQKVIDKQNELELKIKDLKYRDRSKTRTEEDLLKRLDEMELVEELEDEMDRVDEIIENGDVDHCFQNYSDDEELKTTPTPKIKRSVSFADDEDEPETIELNFRHSDVLPDDSPYNASGAITKPSDIYDAYKSLFSSETTSILKKSNVIQMKKVSFENNLEMSKNALNQKDDPEQIEERTIVIKDVVEKQELSRGVMESSSRPTSLFKKKRQLLRK